MFLDGKIIASGQTVELQTVLTPKGQQWCLNFFDGAELVDVKRFTTEEPARTAYDQAGPLARPQTARQGGLF